MSTSPPVHSLRPCIEVDVVMRREPVQGPMRRWQAWRWVLADVLPQGEPFERALPPAGAPLGPAQTQPEPVAPLQVGAGGAEAQHFRFRGFSVGLFRDDAEGYFLNLSSPQPCFWVVWRPDEAPLSNGEPMALPQTVTLSYHDAGRWLDAQERVEQVPAPAPVLAWLQAFVDQHHQLEPKRRKRPDSFKPLLDRFGQPVRISTDKRGPGPGGQGSGGHG